ncbi:dicarboxylate/amino acid:cation symporter [Bacillus paralicheniformis]|uniref:dicarboxylate/amino acid:cation symporter n=1 Tax=Bacillus paralicheniformis TaxID=1648923 RepID=UPI000D03E49B|nr:dicarboxylate/amino acid:cation symporter [Bacillus paralicheniformis]MBG9881493.1 sodium:dicarboxylate symporter [Bacillus paralicheniformis]MCB6219543.1 dicarboxylate/amino acid:cation symporter [Bacillus paralicheniformis]MCJ8221666.1 dicarboxylate/amino acid:cation symporter [Bacillus paralicheniformis]MCU4666536.1 dicarboxylate/amino acid:cation symporter [Bacillus paralicheniformis]MDE1393920.1 dicarboxylate/amino acid:cation symporter [Bacillus paralicheniformis]
MKLATKIIIALLLGAAVGIILNVTSPDVFSKLNTFLFGPLGTIFLNLIKMLVVPIVFFSLTLGVAGLGDPKKLGRIGAKTISFFLVTTAIAIIIGLVLALVIKPGTIGTYDTSAAEYSAQKAPSIAETLLNIIPTNPVQAMAEGNMLQIIAFSILVGLGITMLGKKADALLKVVEQGNDLMMYLVNLVMKFAPYGTFGLIAGAIGSQGWDAIKAMGLYMIVVILALFIHTIVTYGSAIAFLAKRNPLTFFKDFSEVMLVAFSTSSSNATLPVSMDVAQRKLKVPEPISSFVQPLGATINMDGTAIMQGVATVFIAQVYGNDLSLTQLLMVVLTAVLASIGTAGVPGVGLIMLAMVLQTVGLPVEGIALILGIDRLLDMIRTAVNTTGDAACAVIVTETEKKHGKIEAPHSEVSV